MESAQDTPCEEDDPTLLKQALFSKSLRDRRVLQLTVEFCSEVRGEQDKKTTEKEIARISS